jgi:DNA adenine methylase
METALVDTKVESKARPFLKWAGGKGQLIDEIDKRLPDMEMQQGKIDTYVEPFVGGGAVFFHIAQKYPKLKHLVLIDINEDLVRCYKAVREDVDRLIAELQRYEDAYLGLPETERKSYYYEMREKFNEEKATAFGSETAAKLIFLNRTCFNGLYRVNRKGKFNVPKESPRCIICPRAREDSLRALPEK